jgi:predicted nucleotidyltransferase
MRKTSPASLNSSRWRGTCKDFSGKKIDLVMKSGIRPELKDIILKEVIYI